MKIINAQTKKTSDWTQDIVKSSMQKEASLLVSSGKIICPITNESISTINCELCDYCSGIGLKLADSSERVRCTYSFATNNNEKEIDSLNKFSSSDIDLEKDIDGIDLKGIFAKNELKDNFEQEERMSGNRIVSAKNISTDEFEGSSNFISQYNNSIFNQEKLEELDVIAKNKALEKQKQKDMLLASRKEKESEWIVEKEKELKELNFSKHNLAKAISHELESNNPDVGEYKFSAFDNIQDRLDKIPEKTYGEMLKEQKNDRKNSISRTAQKDEWEEDSKSAVTSDSILNNFFYSLFNEK